MKLARAMFLAGLTLVTLQLSSGAAEKETLYKMNANDPIVTFETSAGTFKARLFSKEAPNTVANFVGLASGTKEFTDPATGKKTKKAFFDGLIFHRVIPDFMIQGGDPLGTGTGGPGYQFDNEDSAKKFDKPGILAMANAGRNTNGSQFFVTVAATPWLNGGYTIFGEVIEGYDVVKKISTEPTGAQDRPIDPVVMKKVTVKN
jgi:peptidyl-prolyl cis-trans isomerase A (cyclophilin A)